MKFLKFLEEQKEKHAVLAFGRMNPPTTGHEVLVNKVKDVAKDVGGTHHIVLSHSQDKAKNPLTSQQKVKHAKRFFPGTNISVANKEHPNFLSQASELHKKGVTHLHMVAGSDRTGEYHKLLHKYNNVKGPHGHFNFKHIEVHSAGERDPDAEGTSGMSASKMRGHAGANEFHHFKKGIPGHVPEHHAKELFHDVRHGMQIKESLDEEFESLEQFLIEGVHDKSIFKAVFLGGGPGSGKDFVLSKTLDGHGLTEINSDKALEFLMDKNNLDMRMPDSEEKARNVVRNKAKTITELRQKLALLGRNGLIINGTGDDPEKVKKIKDRLDQLGYESSMLVVNTRNEVSASRNVERGTRGGRTVPESIRQQKWQAVQDARPELAKIFGSNYMEVDNSDDLRNVAPEIRQAKEDEFTQLYKNIQKFVSKPPKNDVSKQWIADELEKKDTLPVPKKGSELTPHGSSNAAEQARQLGLQYFGFGRYGKNGKVTHRSVHDKLVEVQKASVNEQFEDFLSEAVTVSITGDDAEEVGKMMKLLTSNPEPEEVEEQLTFSNDGAKNLLTLGTDMNISEINNNGFTLSNNDLDDILGENLMRDSKGKIRVFMLRAGAAKEAHHNNGVVYPNKNTKQGGYVIKLNEEKNNVNNTILNESVQTVQSERTNTTTYSGKGGRITLSSIRARENGKTGYIREQAELTSSQEYSKSYGVESAGQENAGTPAKNTISKIRAKQKEIKVKESIDKGIESGLSMAGAGESIGRDMGEKLRKKDGKISVAETIGDGGEAATSISDKKEDDLKKVGINLSTFKARRPIG
jgi:hypothetical protein